MSTSLEEGYKAFKRLQNGDYSVALNPIASCIFDDHRLGIDGLENRNRIRAAYPNVYKDLEKTVALEDFVAVVGRVKLHLFTKEK